MKDSTEDCELGADDHMTPENTQNFGGSLQTNSYVYRDDVVWSSKQDGMLGVVMEVPGDSDSDSSDSDESDVDDGDGDRDGAVDGNDSGTVSIGESGKKNDGIAGGQARIMWMDGSETTNDLADVSVVDRAFLHGDIVSSITNPMGQLGLVVDVNIMVDLLSPIGELIKNVSSRDLKRFREFTVGDYVVCGPWLGRVDDMVENVTVLFDDGSVCKVMKADPSRLKPISKSIADDSGFPYYPGQRVRAASSSVFKGSRWLSGLWKANRLEGTVTKVQAGSVFIYWIASSNPGEGANRDAVPSEEQNPKDLTLLSCFSHANWQLGEWCLFPGPTTKDIDNHNDECKSDTDKLNGDLIYENGKVVDGHNHIDSHQLKGGIDTNCLPAKKINGIIKHNQSNVCNYEESDMEEDDSRSEACGASPELDSCTGIPSSSKEPTRESWPAYRKKLRKVFFKREKRGHKRDEPYEKAFLLVNIMTKADVAWQDGTRESNVDSKLLVPIKSPGDLEFFPEQYVIEKALNESDSPEEKLVGVVKSVNAKERIACIRWLKPVTRPEEVQEIDKEEKVSVYELDVHPDYDYCYGDVVVRLSPICVPTSSTICGTPVEKQEDHIDATQKDNETDTNNAFHDVENCSNGGPVVDVSNLSWVGHITGLKDGDIEVTWGDGMVSKVGPQAIYVVGREDDEETYDGGSEYSDGASWETVEENDMTTVDVAEEESVLLPPIDNSKKGEDDTGSHTEDSGLVQHGPLSTAINFVTNFASGFFYQGRKHIDLLESNERNLNESEVQENLDLSVKGTGIDESSSQEPGLGCDAAEIANASTVAFSLKPVDTIAELNSPAIYVSNEASMADDRSDSNYFKYFDITQNPLDNYFLGSKAQISGDKKWVKKVQQEWSMLEKNLPDEIYVRVFEDRMDLLRAVIVGACGTPYQDGLFFFDFHLPPEYPQVPPSAYYHSGGLRVNPNLYENGKVCLSLLNTWTGKGNEVWDPSSSSILQVLVSIQGLVLNSRPYFNEAGYEKQIGTVEGEKNYLPYNENTFLLNLKSMMYLLRKPPVHFEEFVKDHFQRRGHYILKACDAYMNGCLVGSLTKDACMSDTSNENSCCAGFKLMLNKILPRLYSALSEVGAECQQFEHWR